MASKRPSYTTEEQKEAWKKRNYKRYITNLRYDTDQELIDFVEANKEKMGTTNIFRDALEMYVKAQKTEG